MRSCFPVFLIALALFAQRPGPVPGGYSLPNGWRITPAGRMTASTEDLVLNVSQSPDGRVIVAQHGGFNPHGLVVLDASSGEALQRIRLKSAWLGLSWSPDGKHLYVSGGNANSRRDPSRAPVYVFGYANGRLTGEPLKRYEESLPLDRIYWSGVARHPGKNLLYAANRGTENDPGNIAVFDTESGELLERIPVEINPYDVILSQDHAALYVSNWASDSVSVIDTETRQVKATLPVGDNPNDMLLTRDGRLFVACANDNSIVVIDTRQQHTREKIFTALYPNAPAGATPNALAVAPDEKTLYAANADNNSVAVIDITKPGFSNVVGFIPAGWYPSALTVTANGRALFIGNSKGVGSYSNIRGPRSPLPPGEEGAGSVKSLQKGSIQMVDLAQIRSQLKKMTAQVYENAPYRDELLTRPRSAPAAKHPIPSQVGGKSPMRHVIYIIKENRTYDQVLGDLPQGNGDPRLTIFGRQVTPNHHAIAEQYVLFDNLYCDGEVSVDGHSWSNAAYATDFNEKYWPPNYGGHSKAGRSLAFIPPKGFLWDQARRKGLTYRSYGEMAARTSEGMQAAPGIEGLVGHVAPKFKLPGMRDTDNAREFIREFDEFEKNYDSPDAAKRLPAYSVMSLGENHTVGTTPGRPTPVAAVASNDYALGMIVDRVSRSRYWPETAIFVIEDDAQDGSDHVDARRTVGLVISPYTKRKFVDSTLYTTSSMLRTMELILGLPPMSQFDAAATPMYNAFMETPDAAPFTHLKPQVDINALNPTHAWGAQASLAMDFSDYDRTPMFELNEIVWKSVKGADSEMPRPTRRFHFRPR
jgi:YVTN family beta-propeller protein